MPVRNKMQGAVANQHIHQRHHDKHLGIFGTLYTLWVRKCCPCCCALVTWAQSQKDITVWRKKPPRKMIKWCATDRRRSPCYAYFAQNQTGKQFAFSPIHVYLACCWAETCGAHDNCQISHPLSSSRKLSRSGWVAVLRTCARVFA